MALPPLTHQLATKLLTEFCARRTLPEVHAQVRVSFEIRANTITISEHRPAWDDPTQQTAMKIAVLVYDAATRAWDLFAQGRPIGRVWPPRNIACSRRALSCCPGSG